MTHPTTTTTPSPTGDPPALDNPKRFDRSKLPDDAEGIAYVVFSVLSTGPRAALESDGIPLGFSQGLVDGLVEAFDGLIAGTADSEDADARAAHDACVLIRKMFDADVRGGTDA